MKKILLVLLALCAARFAHAQDTTIVINNDTAWRLVIIRTPLLQGVTGMTREKVEKTLALTSWEDTVTSVHPMSMPWGLLFAEKRLTRVQHSLAKSPDGKLDSDIAEPIGVVSVQKFYNIWAVSIWFISILLTSFYLRWVYNRGYREQQNKPKKQEDIPTMNLSIIILVLVAVDLGLFFMCLTFTQALLSFCLGVFIVLIILFLVVYPACKTFHSLKKKITNQ